ncbi:glycosyl hydrolase family 28-related protein [Plantactinospora sp. ZYX-F-223]|uniref:glycosyl hydrolase family 28-related protein n=1 Tax=Plantactinospora sp. ZYX-F-223 TaxID=3144103 RepID=UPI0031FC9666
MSERTNRRALLLAGGAALGAAAAVAPWQATPAAADVPDGVVTPQQFGALADGVHDDTAAIQQAIDSQRDAPGHPFVLFPPGTYKITRTIVVPDLTDEPYNRIQLRGYGTMGNRASTIKQAHAGVGMHIQSSLAAIHGLCFEATVDLDQVGLRFSGVANTDDMDGAILDCTFIQFDTAIQLVGRGLYFSRNLVAQCATGISLSWPTGNTGGDDAVHHPPYGLRKWLITDNHFHTVQDAIVTTPTSNGEYRSAIIQGNLLDIGRRLFRGSLTNSTISGNVVEHAQGDAAIITITSGGHNLTIADNVLGGFEMPITRSAGAITFATGFTPHNVTISGNSFNWTRETAVRFLGGASRVTIANNTFDNWHMGTDALGAAIRVVGAATDTTVIGNVFSPDATNRAPLRVDTLTRSHVIGNTYPQPNLVAVTTVNDSQIQTTPGKFNQLEVTHAGADGRIRVINSMGTIAAGGKYGSFLAAGHPGTAGNKGGIRVVAVNGTGSAATELLCATNTSNEVVAITANATGLIPPADNLRDLGAADKRMRAVYTHQLALAEQAPTELPKATDNVGGLVLIKDPKTGKRTLALSDGEAWHAVPLGDKL